MSEPIIQHHDTGDIQPGSLPTGAVVVYHDKCHDGITALWCFMQRWPHAEPYPALHGTPPDLDRLRGRRVAIVDFAWPRAQLEAVHAVAASLIVLDHHETAQADLAGLPFAEFDMDRSGAGMAWDYLNPGKPRPPLVNYVEDRDLWRFKLPNCREVHAACNAWPLTLESRRKLMAMNVDDLASEGAAILRYHDKLVESACERASRTVVAGHSVPFVECPCIELVSDIGVRLAAGEAFAAIRVPDPERHGHTMSLRSAPDGLNVAVVSKAHGGGGHKHAAGYFVKDATHA